MLTNSVGETKDLDFTAGGGISSKSLLLIKLSPFYIDNLSPNLSPFYIDNLSPNLSPLGIDILSLDLSVDF